MSAPSTSGLSVELLLRVIDVKYGLLYFLFKDKRLDNKAWSLEEAWCSG